VIVDLAAAIRDAKPGDTLKIPAGRYTGNFEIDKPLTLLAFGQVVLDGVHRGSVLRIVADGVVRLSGLLLAGGDAAEAGGGLCVVRGTVELSDCIFRFNKAPLHGGGGLYVLDAKVTADRCRFEGNTGRQGGGILVDGAGELLLRDSAIIQNAAVEGGGLRAKEGAKVELSFCTIADNKAVGDAAAGSALHFSGTTTRKPTVTVRDSIISERTEASTIFNSDKLPADVTFTRSLVPSWSKVSGEGVLTGDPKFMMSGNEPYLLGEGSPAIGAGVASTTKDLNGHGRSGKTDLGAFSFVRRTGGSSVGY